MTVNQLMNRLRELCDNDKAHLQIYFHTSIGLAPNERADLWSAEVWLDNGEHVRLLDACDG